MPTTHTATTTRIRMTCATIQEKRGIL